MNSEFLWIYRNGKWDLPKGKVEKDEMYKTFNMGIGMVFIVDSKDQSHLINHLSQFLKPYLIGEISKGSRVVIK